MKLFIQKIIHIEKNYSIKYSFKKNWQLFIQRDYSFFWKISYRPGLLVPDNGDLSSGGSCRWWRWGGRRRWWWGRLRGRQGLLPPCSSGITFSSIPSLATRPSVAMASEWTVAFEDGLEPELYNLIFNGSIHLLVQKRKKKIEIW